MTPSTPVEQLLAAADLVTPMAIRAAVETGVVDALADGPVHDPHLAAGLGLDDRVLTIVVDHLVHAGILDRDPDGAVTTTDVGALLLPSASVTGLRELLDPTHPAGRNELELTSLSHTLRTGRPAAEAADRGTLWQQLDAAGDRDDLTAFDRDEPGFAAEVLLDHPIWDGIGHAVDIGGNTGSLALALLRRHPHLRVTVVDLPRFAHRAGERAEAAGLADRLTAVPGSFFEPLPAGADAYLLSAILADWDDDACEQLLGRCAEAAGPAPVVVAEVHLTTGAAPPAQRTAAAVRLEASVTRPDRGPTDVADLLRANGFEVEDARTGTPERSVFVSRAVAEVAA